MSLSNAMSPLVQDHAVQGMAIVPGSVFLDLALASRPESLADVEFRQLLSASELNSRTLRTGVDGDSFYIDSHDENTTRPISSRHVVGRFDAKTAAQHKGVSELRARAESRRQENADGLSRHEVYERLWKNGNHYRETFQIVKSAWIDPTSALTELRTPAAHVEFQRVHPVLLDACVQSLAITQCDRGQAFLLLGVQRVSVRQVCPDRCWCFASVTPARSAQSSGVVGDVLLLNEDGDVLVEMLGVQLSFIQEGSSEQEADSISSVAVAASFTVDPLADALKFWMNSHARVPVRIAPYNQIFQQLLDPSGFFAYNANGVNVVLLRFEDWLRHENRIESLFDDDQLQSRLDQWRQKAREFDPNCDIRRLPNGAEIAHINNYETDYLYKEIFANQAYLKHGIQLKEGDCVVDVGANIGIFSLFAQHVAKRLKLYAFEPAPPAFDALRTNTSLYCRDAKVFNCGISDRDGELTFTYYAKSSVFSSFHPDKNEDAHAIKSIVRNVLKSNSLDAEQADSVSEAFMTDRLDSKAFQCQIRSLSSIIREENIQQIDLLKLDSEKSELPVLRGIEDDHWDLIKQMVIEVHDSVGDIYRQIRELLTKKGFHCEVEEEQLLTNSGLYNIFATRTKQVSADANGQPTLNTVVKENVRQLSEAVRTSAARAAAPHLICICPGTADESSSQATFFHTTENELAEDLADVPGVHVIRSSEYLARYPVDAYHEPEGDRLGHVPYTPAFFAAIGTTIARRVAALQRKPRKVIVLDCDNTLWKGVCGEDGTQGIELNAAHLALQQFMLDRRDEGMLLCLCSKNTQADVDAVFSDRGDMVLRVDDIVSSRINWLPKSQNLASIADELQLGLDSFIFVDDNPVECAEVRSACPEVLTLQLPEHAEEIAPFLHHTWEFDNFTATAEDEIRSSLYKDQVKREQFRQTTLTLGEFVSELDVQVSIEADDGFQYARVAQLTQRTNQFNFTTIRRIESQIRQLGEQNEVKIRTVNVRDRFGDYGLVGVMIYKTGQSELRLDSLMLSCRVLGRGVEHQMLAYLGKTATDQGITEIAVDFTPTDKNEPAKHFLDSLTSTEKHDTEYRFSAAKLSRLKFSPLVEETTALAVETEVQRTQPDQPDNLPLFEYSREFQNVEQILAGINSASVRARPKLAVPYRAPQSDLEKSLASAWENVLSVKPIGLEDNFFEIGGTSLKGVQLVANLKSKLSINVSIVDLFACHTIEAMVKTLENADSTTAQSEKSQGRGLRRREKRRVRKRVNM